jgi:hypothetical protein
LKKILIPAFFGRQIPKSPSCSPVSSIFLLTNAFHKGTEKPPEKAISSPCWPVFGCAMRPNPALTGYYAKIKQPSSHAT